MNRSIFIKWFFVALLIGCIGTVANGQEDASIQVLAKSTSDKTILLRWAVDQPLAWKRGNEHGYLVERYTISKNGNAVIPVESTMITPSSLKPRPLEEWESIATSDDYAAVIAQAIYGDDFDISTMGSPDNIFAVNEQLEQRFTFALMAAEQSYEAAKIAGWALEDESVKTGEKYLYKVKINLPQDSKYTIKEGSIYVSTDSFEELPKPFGFASIFADGNALLNWNFNLLQKTYSSYILEKSTDGNSYKKVSGQPIFNAQNPKEGEQVSLFYTDSIPNNKMFYYRIKGITPFGEIGPPSQVESGMGLASLDYTPHILRKRLPTENTVELEWEFAEAGNSEISGFALKRADRPEGPYELVLTNIPAIARKATHTGLKRINYFTVVAVGINGTEKPSFPAIVQPVDSIPPSPPKKLAGLVDTTGVVRLSWEKNPEVDLAGYRVFKANNSNAEFAQITLSLVTKNQYTDTISMQNLNTKVYYKIIAEDQRYNNSDFSEILELDKPDLIPPSPPVIKNYESDEKGITITWVNSSSDDVGGHIIYRKDLASKEERWVQIAEIEIGNSSTTYTDPNIKPGNPYAYTVIAFDKAGLESTPTSQVVLKAPKKLFAKLIAKFNGVVDRESRRIRLTWKTDEADISEFLVYRSEEDEPLSLYKTIDSDQRSFIDTNLTISTRYTYGLQLVKKDGTQSQLETIKLTY